MADQELPKFDALRTYLTNQEKHGHFTPPEVIAPVRAWIDKLEVWCKERLAAIERLENRKEELLDQLSAWEEELQTLHDRENEYGALTQALRDHMRGIATWREVEDLIPTPLGEKSTKVKVYR